MSWDEDGWGCVINTLGAAAACRTEVGIGCWGAVTGASKSCSDFAVSAYEEARDYFSDNDQNDKVEEVNQAYEDYVTEREQFDLEQYVDDLFDQTVPPMEDTHSIHEFSYLAADILETASEIEVSHEDSFSDKKRKYEELFLIQGRLKDELINSGIVFSDRENAIRASKLISEAALANRAKLLFEQTITLD